MDAFFLTFFALLIILLLIGMPALLSLLIYRYMKRKGYNAKYRAISIVPVLVLGYFIYGAVYPSEEFYRTDFKEVTGIELIENAEFDYKSASWPDHFGDYTSVSIIKVDTFFYEQLKTNLLEQGFDKNNHRGGHREMTLAYKKLKDEKISQEFSKHLLSKFYYVAFLSDQETILVQRTSW